MPNAFTLDALRDETIRRYAPVEIDLGDDNVVELKSLLRLREKDRKAAIAAIEEINSLDPDEDDEDSLADWSETIVESCSKIFRLITASHKKLIAKLDHEDPIIKANLFSAVLYRWVGGSQLGEAESSPA